MQRKDLKNSAKLLKNAVDTVLIYIYSAWSLVALGVDAHEKWPEFEHRKLPKNEHFGGRGVVMRPVAG